MSSNDPKVLVEFSPEEIAWLADKLNELRQGWTAAALFKATGIQQRGGASESEKQMLLKIEEEKKVEAVIRNRLLDKASDQGFGNL